MKEIFYFLRQPDRMIESSDNLPSCCNIEVIKARHKIFKTREEAEKYQAALGVEPLSVRQEMNKDFRRMGMAEFYGYESKMPEQSGNHKLAIKDYREFILLVKKMRKAQEVEAMLSWEEDEEFVSLVKRMRDAQNNVIMMERFASIWTADDHFAYNDLRKEQLKLESEVDEYLKKVEL